MAESIPAIRNPFPLCALAFFTSGKILSSRSDILFDSQPTKGPALTQSLHPVLRYGVNGYFISLSLSMIGQGWLPLRLAHCSTVIARIDSILRNCLSFALTRLSFSTASFSTRSQSGVPARAPWGRIPPLPLLLKELHKLHNYSSGGVAVLLPVCCPPKMQENESFWSWIDSNSGRHSANSVETVHQL